MKLAKYQKGLSIWSLSFAMFLIGFSVYIALKVFPVYMENFNVIGVLESIENEVVEYHGALSVKQAVMKRLNINDVMRVTSDDVSVIRDNQEYMIEISYEVIVPFMGNISLLFNFNHTASVRASV